METRGIATSAALLIALACADARAANDMGPTRAAQAEVRVVHHQVRSAKLFKVERTNYLFLFESGRTLDVLQGQRLQKRLGLVDPIELLKARLIAVLERHAALRNLRAVPGIAEDTSLDALKGRFRSGLVLSLSTKHWGMHDNRVKYYAEARLYDLDASSELWGDHCRWVILDEDHRAPEWEALTANNGALLKANLRRAAERCADEIAGRLVDAAKTREVVAALEARRSAPSAPPAAAGFAGLPQVGDRWEYSYAEGRRQRRANVEIAAVTPSRIEEWVSIGGGKLERRSYGKEPTFAFNKLWHEFSPYFASFGEPAPGASWADLDPRSISVCARASVTCRLEGRVAGREEIVTAAGSFDAIRIVLGLRIEDSNRTSAGFTGLRQIEYWYAPEAKRMVKMRFRTLSGYSQDADYLVDLVSYELH